MSTSWFFTKRERLAQNIWYLISFKSRWSMFDFITRRQTTSEDMLKPEWSNDEWWVNARNISQSGYFGINYGFRKWKSVSETILQIWKTKRYCSRMQIKSISLNILGKGMSRKPTLSSNPRREMLIAYKTSGSVEASKKPFCLSVISQLLCVNFSF